MIDAEIEKEAGSLCVAGNQIGAVIWHLAVLPEYRRNHIAASLWDEVKSNLNPREFNIVKCGHRRMKRLISGICHKALKILKNRTGYVVTLVRLRQTGF